MKENGKEKKRKNFGVGKKRIEVNLKRDTVEPKNQRRISGRLPAEKVFMQQDCENEIVLSPN